MSKKPRNPNSWLGEDDPDMTKQNTHRTSPQTQPSSAQMASNPSTLAQHQQPRGGKQSPCLSERHSENLASFSQALQQHRFWHVLPKGESDCTKATALFDQQTRLLYPTADGLRVVV